MSELTFTLDEESEKKLLELMADVNVAITPSFTIHDKHGQEAEYVKIIRCKDCKWKVKHNCTRAVEVFINDQNYCSWAERKEE